MTVIVVLVNDGLLVTWAGIGGEVRRKLTVVVA